MGDVKNSDVQKDAEYPPPPLDALAAMVYAYDRRAPDAKVVLTMRQVEALVDARNTLAENGRERAWGQGDPMDGYEPRRK